MSLTKTTLAIAINNRYGRNARPEPQEPQHRINSQIRVKEVRLVGENVTPEVYSIEDALRIARELGVDLVEISPKAEPPVCRAVEYSKFLYDQKKKQKALKANAAKVVEKEIRFGPQTDDHDYDFKKKHATKFLQEGCKIRAFVFFKGRSIIYKDQGEILLLRLATELEEWGKVDQLPKLDGKKMILLLSPKKKK